MNTRQPNHKCRICGKEYYACLKCDKVNHWKALACSIEHYQAYQLFLSYSRNEITSDDLVKGLRKLGFKKHDILAFSPDKVEIYQSAIAPSVAD